MKRQKFTLKLHEWFRRYLPAEVLGTAISLLFAWVTYQGSGSYLAAAGAGFVGEGIGFYGYFITKELISNEYKTRNLPFFKRIITIITKSSANLLVEFAPAEILDNFFIRPFAMYIVPQLIHPYALGFIIGKLGADIIFYILVIASYETKKYVTKKRQRSN